MDASGPAPDLQSLAARPHDPQAGDLFVRLVHQLVRRYCRALLGRSGRDFRRADELAGEVAEAVLRERGEALHGPGPVEAVLYAGMAPPVQRALEERDEPPQAGGAGGGVGAGPLSPERVQEQLVHLPPRTREVLVLRAFVGLTGDQVGRALGLPADTVREEQRRAMRFLARSTGR